LAKAVRPLASRVGGETFGDAASGLIEHAPHIGAAVAGMEGYRYLNHSPSLPARAARGAVRVINRNVPGTAAYDLRNQEVAYGSPQFY
jgi:hypothetical protein